MMIRKSNAVLVVLVLICFDSTLLFVFLFRTCFGFCNFEAATPTNWDILFWTFTTVLPYVVSIIN